MNFMNFYFEILSQFLDISSIIIFLWKICIFLYEGCMQYYYQEKFLIFLQTSANKS